MARTAAQIQAEMGQTLSGQEPGLVGYWNFNDGTARDGTGHGHDAVLGGADAANRPALVVSTAPLSGGTTPPPAETGLPCWTVFLDANGNGQLDPGERRAMTGLDGTYALTGLVPGTYTVAVATQDGWQQTAPAAPLTRTVTIGSDGTMVRQQDFGETHLRADLFVSPASLLVSPAAANVGQPLSVSWSVQNIGTAPAVGSWQDAVYISPTPTLGAAAQLLVTIPHDGPLAAGGEYPGHATIDVPPIAAGTYYVIVQSDRRNQVFEGEFHANKANNITSSTALEVTIPTLVLGEPRNDQFTAVGQSRYYQVVVPEGATLWLQLTSSAPTGANELYLRAGAPPTVDEFDAHVANLTPGGQLTFGPARAGTYFIQVHNQWGPADGSQFTLTASSPDFAVLGISNSRGGNTGTVTVRVDGAGFDDWTTVELVRNSQRIPAVWQHLTGSTQLDVTFDLIGVPAGVYDLRAVRGVDLVEVDPDTGKAIRVPYDTGEASLPGAFEVVAGGSADVQVETAYPSAARAGQGFSFLITVTNQGLVDAPLPVLYVRSPNATPVSMQSDVSATDSDQLHLVILGQRHRRVLGPGETIQVRCYAFANQPDESLFSVSNLANMPESLDWASIEDYYKELEPDVDWAQTWSNFLGIVGNTWDSLHDAMRRSANELTVPDGTKFVTGGQVILDLLSRAEHGQRDASGFTSDTDLYHENMRWSEAGMTELLNAFNDQPRAPTSGSGEFPTQAANASPLKGPNAKTCNGSSAELICAAPPLTFKELTHCEALARTLVGLLYHVYGVQATTVVHDFVHSTKEDPAASRPFADGSEVVEGMPLAPGFKNSSETREKMQWVLNAAKEQIIKKVKKCELQLPPNAEKDIPLEYLFSKQWMEKVGEIFVWGVQPSIPALLAGQISLYSDGTPQDSRKLSGYVTAKRITEPDPCCPNKERTVKVELTSHFHLYVDDTFDFCPGGLGDAWWVIPFTTALAKLEANDRANDVKFTVDFDAIEEPGEIPGDQISENCEKKDKGKRSDAAAKCKTAQKSDNCPKKGSQAAGEAAASLAASCGCCDKSVSEAEGGASGSGSDKQCPINNTPNGAKCDKKKPKSVQIIWSFDPNDLVGPGVGDGHWVESQQALPYTIHFENDAQKASASAQDVTITESLDPSLDWSRFELGPIQFGATTVEVPDGLQSFATSVDTTNVDGTPLRVSIAAGLNLQTGVVTWTFRSLDPVTGQTPENPFAGFLPVNDSTGRGQGQVTYTIRAETGLTTGAPFDAQASIVFDVNPALDTNTFTNSMDAGAPVSKVNALPSTSSPNFLVTRSGTDDAGGTPSGSGIAVYDVYVSDNGGAFSLWQDYATATSATFDGSAGHRYAFYSLATDNVGHRQTTPAAPATTQVVGQHVWHNYANPYDVNGVDCVTPLDVLLIINWINAHPGGTSLPAPPAVPPPYYDVSGGANSDGDGQITPLDVLVVINYINSHPAGSPEGESPESLVPAPTAAAASLASIRRSAETGLPPKWNRIPPGTVCDPEAEFGQLNSILPDIVQDVHRAWHKR